ncbi:putative protein PHLOEM PROTEIN 2-LIKE A3 [Acorus calamus]|uniref:Uncharacterized protein n=1 Tax=Acorus calamus TaxID=4465 RepID=A0AAV9D4W4_ACOCL|nr:putative protein PHLOEM PROTEIN 2-LIKE A3 [Acorus calamus]
MVKILRVKDADDKSDLLNRVRSGGIYLDNKRMGPEDFKGKWGELVVGEFNSGDSTGRVTFGLFDIESGQWKGGLIVKGVMFKGLLNIWNSHEARGSEEDVELARLRDVCYLEVHRGFDASLLSPNVNYEVVFIMTMREFSHGWHNILTLRLERPDNTEHEQKLNLDPEDFKGKWGELVVGEFNSGDSTGRVTFGLFDIESGQWKGGLIVKGVMVSIGIKPDWHVHKHDPNH